MTASEDYTSPKSKLEGSRLISLHKLNEVVTTISAHSASCGAPVHLTGEVRRNGLALPCLPDAQHVKLSSYLTRVLKWNSYKRTRVNCLDDIADVVRNSASVNHPQLVGHQDGTSIVPFYDWSNY